MTGAGDLQDLIHSFRISASLSVAAELGISDLLAAGPRSLTDLASATSTDEDTLGRLLRALVAIDVYAEPEDATFTLASLGEGLRSDVPGSLRPLARTLQDPAIWSAWGHLPTASAPVRTRSRPCTASTCGPTGRPTPSRTPSSTTT